MKKILGMYVSIITALTSINADEWIKTYGYGEGRCVQQTTDNGYIILATGWLGATVLIKTDSEGDTIWTKSFKDSVSWAPRSVRQTIDKGYIVASEYGDGYIIKTDSMGNKLWDKRYSQRRPHWIEQTKDSGYIITGSCIEAFLMKTNSKGDTVWTRNYLEDYTVYGTYRVLLYPGGGYGIVGWVYRGWENWDIFLIRTDSLGDTLWTRMYGSTQEPTCEQTRWAALTDDGGVIIMTGKSRGDGYVDPALLKVDSTGNKEWEKAYLVIAEVAECGQQAYDGGYVFIALNGYGLWLIKTDATGDSTWAKNFSDFGGGQNIHKVAHMEETRDSGYIIVGVGVGGIYVIKTSNSVGVEEDAKVKTRNVKLKIWPNPFINKVTINCNISKDFNSQLRLYNLTGRIIQIFDPCEQIDFNTSKLPMGYYFLELKIGRYKEVVKLIKIGGGKT